MSQGEPAAGSTRAKSGVPSIDQLSAPTIRALHRLGGSASITEMLDAIIEDLGLPETITQVPHGRGSQTELEYRSAWARTYLKNEGLIENSNRAVWALTTEGLRIPPEDAERLVRARRSRRSERRETGKDQLALAAPQPPSAEVHEPEPRTWREDLLDRLLAMDPIAFERLCQRLLREAGFIEVEVTRRSSDGGIDGYGTIRIGGLISFNVLFQSKRYQSSLGPDVVRDFRGAMVGRADKGLIITTGSFTREARREATRDGAPPIDLIDGELLVDKLKELGLGVRTRMVERVEVDHEWFALV